MVRLESRNLPARLGAILAVAAVAVSLGLARVDAAAAETGADPYCAVLIGKATEGKPSPVLARACDDTSAANAREKMFQAASKDDSKTVKPLAADLLMTWYSDTDYHGASTNIFGDDGPCDRAGYRLDVKSATFGLWSHILSSARGAGPCNTARFANRAGTSSQEFGLPVPYLGSLLNDNVGTIWVYNR